MPTLSEALSHAAAYWEAKGPSSRMMLIRAKVCAKGIPSGASGKLRGMQGMNTRVEDLGPMHGAAVLTHLRRTGKSKGSVASYYAAFKRAIELAGGDTRQWPKADTPPRRCREPLSEPDIERVAGMLEGYIYKLDGNPTRGHNWETYDLLELLRGTGLRVEREALNGEALQWDAGAKTLKVTGKGGHERMIPVERPTTVALLNSPERMRAMRKLSYSGHLKRWNAALDRLKITSLKPTPHAVRHYYATRAYERSGHNLKLVQELLGHVDIATTSRYLGVDMELMRQAVA